MIPLTEGALDNIMAGIDVEKPILQILGHKKISSSSSKDRYRLLVSDGIGVNSLTLLATKLNSMVTDNILTEFSICQLNKYVVSSVNKDRKQKRIMVILSLDLKVPGEEVCYKIGNLSNIARSVNTEADTEKRQPIQAQNVNTVPQYNKNHMSDINIIPIVALNRYQNKWVIKVRVTNKSSIQIWSNSRGEGKLFCMDLVDESGEIRCTAFQDQCDQFFDKIEVGKVYYVSQCNLKSAKKNFTTLKNDYEMSMTPNTEIIQCYDDVENIPSVPVDFLPISSIEQKEKNDIIDILGIVKSCDEVQTLRARVTGRKLRKRNVTLIDESNTKVCLSLWNAEAENFNGTNNSILAIKGARIDEFNGEKSLSTLISSIIQIDPDISEAHKLRRWYNSIGISEQAKCLSINGPAGCCMTGTWLTLREAKYSHLGFDGAADFFIAKVHINMIRTENILYKSCLTEGCYKKMRHEGHGIYWCKKCCQEFPSFKYRLLASINFGDHTANHWATVFNNEAEKILNTTAQELGDLLENNKYEYLEKLKQAAFKSYIVKFRVKLEMFNDEVEVKTTVVLVSTVDYRTYNDILLTKIKDIVGIEKL